MPRHGRALAVTGECEVKHPAITHSAPYASTAMHSCLVLQAPPVIEGNTMAAYLMAIAPVVKFADGGVRDDECCVGRGGHASGGAQPLLGGRPARAGAQRGRAQDGAGIPVPAALLQGLQLDAAGARAPPARHPTGRLCAPPFSCTDAEALLEN